ncbi:VOC family protein [Actinopolymorpha pittospori]|uniref:Enzyme related to lactoylglutathione lyase n=1 Tax=Actinopolymorpha pittospori TaxID=648752 RepID=A0A927MQS6_9ACTN|nr:VOC family protein [Actinopolymorpha pittospori]MBE1604507.1 putative enzyme related to lactoylglutathione lyase [Actinopolymorpha pittospori]
MTDARMPFRVGSIISADLTVPDAEKVRDFYQAVIGWQVEDFDMGDYNDYLLKTADGDQPVGGVCHARGDNRALPPVWLVYVSVADLEQSTKTCVDLGGKVLTQNDQYAVIQDPAGAILAITREPDTAEF